MGRPSWRHLLHHRCEARQLRRLIRRQSQNAATATSLARERCCGGVDGSANGGVVGVRRTRRRDGGGLELRKENQPSRQIDWPRLVGHSVAAIVVMVARGGPNSLEQPRHTSITASGEASAIGMVQSYPNGWPPAAIR